METNKNVPRCPHCERQNSTDIAYVNNTVYECDACGKPFIVFVEIELWFTTDRADRTKIFAHVETNGKIIYRWNPEDVGGYYNLDSMLKLKNLTMDRITLSHH